MPSSLSAGCLMTCLLVLSGPKALPAQTLDLRQDLAFFQAKLPEFQSWLQQNQLDIVLYADSVSAAPRKVTLYLKASYRGARVCDSLQCAWDRLERNNYQVNGQFFHKRLLHKWAFLAEVHEEQAEVVVRCHDPAHFIRRINSQRGSNPIDGRNIRSGAVVDVRLPASMQGVNVGDNMAILTGKKVKPVCTSARRYLANYYKTKGTPILWQARVDSSYTTVDEFVLE